MRIKVWVRTLVVSMALAILNSSTVGADPAWLAPPGSTEASLFNYVRIGYIWAPAGNAAKIVASAEEDDVLRD